MADFILRVNDQGQVTGVERRESGGDTAAKLLHGHQQAVNELGRNIHNLGDANLLQLVSVRGAITDSRALTPEQKKQALAEYDKILPGDRFVEEADHTGAPVSDGGAGGIARKLIIYFLDP